MFATVSKWGNSIAVRIPSEIAAASGILEGDRVDVSYSADGDIVIQRQKKDKSSLKAFGILHKFADPSLVPLEKDAFPRAMEEKYGSGDVR